ncbi:MAG TPA: hypothetical protein DEA90_09510 [Opitutae bacterium]|nr:hypothetical protein [Puniceicoccaceae bacterium]HBR94386.1 hypothetical protein [Opitutae bacterium]|tara:strand:+ start:125 stop:973 length:849 start_codon:yes stop_codon:yes gene_type:complete
MTYPKIAPYLLVSSLVTAVVSAETVVYYDFEAGSLASTGGSAGALTSVGTNSSIATPFSNISFGGSDANDNNKVLYVDNSSNAFTADAFTIEAVFQYQGGSDVLASTFNSVNASTDGTGIGWLFGTRASENGLWFAYSTDGGDDGRHDIYSDNVSNDTLNMTSGNYYYAALSVDISDTSASGITFYLQDITTAGNSLLSVSATHSGTSIYDSGTEFTIGDIANASVLGGTVSGVNYTGPIDAVRYSNSQLGSGDLLVSVPEPSSFALVAGCLGLLSVIMRRR